MLIGEGRERPEAAALLGKATLRRAFRSNGSLLKLETIGDLNGL